MFDFTAIDFNHPSIFVLYFTFACTFIIGGLGLYTLHKQKKNKKNKG